MIKKIKYIIPFLIIPVITPIYNILDFYVFINIFGCGCVPICATNSLNIPFNTNDLRRTVYTLLAVLVFALAISVSKSITDKKKRITYCIAALIVAIIISAAVCTLRVWK